MIRREYSEDDFLMLSGIQHFAFCKRQWALIHVEKQWKDNYCTASGNIIHDKAHDPFQREKRGDTVIICAMPVHSFSLGISGECDIVEFKKSTDGIPLKNYEGLWSASPVEYKRGSSKSGDCDRLQLTAQVICLEEMLVCDIKTAFLYYDKTHRRETVEITPEFRESVKTITSEMHKYFDENYTPHVKASKKCSLCSLKELCIPKLSSCPTVSDYINSHIG